MGKRILITNDDGIASPGLRRLVLVAREFGEVWVIAPDGERSGVSHHFTYKTPLRVRECDYGIPGVRAYSCSGMPADCVNLGILKILPEKPDYVFAGINIGPNIGPDIQYSGTIGAVMEAAFKEIHAIAFSEWSPDFHEVTDRYLPELMQNCMERPLEKDQAWSINFPRCTLEECKGVAWNCRVAKDEFYADEFSERPLENGETEYQLIPKRIWKPSPGTDLEAIRDNYISVGRVNNLS